MGRLIDEDIVIDIINFECGKWTGLSKTIEKEIKALPPAQPERKKGKWIPCSEQLPEDSNFYIVTRKDFLVGFIWYSVFHGWEWDEQNNIIAWMPLPEEYRGEQDEIDNCYQSD